MMKPPVMTTLIYCLKDAQILLAQRRKEPFRGRWVAPGGKLETGEAPWECAARELKEETGLRADSLQLRGIVTETSAREDWQWLIFIYVVVRFSGQIDSDEREGTLRWWPISEAKAPLVPESDEIFLPPVIDLQQPIYQARYMYDDDLKLTQTIEASGLTGITG